MDRIVGGKYKLGRKIGSGSFGEIYLGLFSLKSIEFSFGFVLDTDFVLLFCIYFWTGAATHVDTFEIVAVKIVSIRILLTYIISICDLENGIWFGIMIG